MGQNGVLCAVKWWILSRYSSKIESVGVRKCPYWYYLAYVTITNIISLELALHCGGKTAGVDTVRRYSVTFALCIHTLDWDCCNFTYLNLNGRSVPPELLLSVGELPQNIVVLLCSCAVLTASYFIDDISFCCCCLSKRSKLPVIITRNDVGEFVAMRRRRRSLSRSPSALSNYYHRANIQRG